MIKNWLIKSHAYQTRMEEFFNTLTHAAGMGLSVAALVLLTVFASMQHSAVKVISCGLFGCSLIAMYTASTMYHTATDARLKRFFKIVDHTTIYGLIAGSYTPVVLVILSGTWGWTLFGLVWALALLGFIFKIFFIGRFEALSLSIYIGMGWLAIIAIDPLWHALTAPALAWLFIGGLFYTGGVLFYSMNKIRFAHALWHVCVLSGSICHFFFVLLYVIPAPLINN